MKSILLFIVAWLIMMSLIGGICLLVGLLNKSKHENNNNDDSKSDLSK